MSELAPHQAEVPEAEDSAPFARRMAELPSLVGMLVRGVAIGLPPLTVLLAFIGIPDPVGWRAIYLMLILPLVFLLRPLRWTGGERKAQFVDFTLALLAVVAFGWILFDRERLVWRMTYVDPLTLPDLLLGIFAILLILEATRRAMGLTLVLVTSVFIAYAFVGPWMPGMLRHKGVPLELLVEHLYLVPEGMFNVITGIMSTYLLTFLLFGTLLQRAGGDRLFMDLTQGLAGRSCGGPAKAAVIGSGLTGSVAASTIANVLTTGTVTIPLMKKTGFRSHEAGAIEAAASAGGALMPPVMGAGVFIMSELTGIPLVTIMLYSALPAVLYFASIYTYVHAKASRRRLSTLDSGDRPKTLSLLVLGFPLLVPLIALVYLLIRDYTPFYCSAVASVLIVVLSYSRRQTRLTPGRLASAFQETTRRTFMLAVTGASAGLIMGVITITGLMQKVSSIMLGLSQGSLFIGILLTGVVATVLGMGLPTTSAYIIISVLGVSALVELGLDTMAAHLAIFWFSQSAAITPPVCMTAFVAASVAQSPPMRTGFEAVRVGKALYVMPFLFAYSHLLGDSIWRIGLDAAGALLGLALIPAVLEGWFRGPLGHVPRAVLAAAAGVAFIATFADDPVTTGALVGSAAVAAVAVYLRSTLLGANTAASRPEDAITPPR